MEKIEMLYTKVAAALNAIVLVENKRKGKRAAENVIAELNRKHLKFYEEHPDEERLPEGYADEWLNAYSVAKKARITYRRSLKDFLKTYDEYPYNVLADLYTCEDAEGRYLAIREQVTRNFIITF